MKTLISIVLGLTGAIVLTHPTLAQQTIYQEAGSAELLLPVEQQQPFSLSIEQKNQEIEQKTKDDRELKLKEASLIEPTCVDSCKSPTAAPNNSNEGVGVVLPVQF